ncbi:modulator of apoptosis 1-like [Lingula anatina]|uniref:Modulator of apoptosis 1-like n=1 Tax=Lingula anatina TaxID=7574 RepID=A0A1S3HCW5_LINAN|nr:modulator of apoptosis 1-like [Lingula anatina]|eukprot:XP_013383868.1 modulator of apoptosis 1-like [Lingula anatina]
MDTQLREQLEALSADDKAAVLQLLSPESARGAAASATAGTSRGDAPQRSLFTSHFGGYSRKLRLFSGKTPVPHGEVDFETWKFQVEPLLADIRGETDNVEATRIIRQSLLRPALDTVREAFTAVQIVEVLESVYGIVVDGKELLVQFFVNYQKEKETPSQYLQRLYLQAMQVVERGGMGVREVPENLLRQFIRGCFDDEMINKLGLEKIDNPPSFAELLLLVRKEEARRTEKKLRLARKKEGRVSSMSVPDEMTSSELEDKKKIAELQARVEKLEAKEQCKSTTAAKPDKSANKPVKPKYEKRRMGSNSRRKIFCYKCGEDGHLVDACKKTSNAELVQEKLLQRTLNK